MPTSKRALFFKWQPSPECIIAILSALLMWPVYYVGTHMDGITHLIIFIILGNIVLNVLLPLFYITMIKKQSLTLLGFTKRLWKTSLIISIILGASSIPPLMHLSATYTPSVIINQIIFNSICLWEVFFVFCWLLLAFDRAFGAILAILLTTGVFVLYHVGSVSTLNLMIFAGICVFYSILFLLTKNILILWPLAWGMQATIGTLKAHLIFTTHHILIYSFVLLIQLFFIVYCWKKQSSNK